MHRIILTVMPSPPDVRCWWVCLFLLLTLDVRGATNSAWFNRVWQTDEGLPDNAVVGIAQTPDGFLRVATQGGLVRFDGNQFRGFVPITEVGALSGLLHGLTVDRRGRLWVVKDRGILACVENGRTTSHTLRRSSANARAVTPVEDADGTLWAAYPADGSRIVALRDGNIRYYGTQDGLPPGAAIQLVCDKLGQLWFATGGQLGVFRDGRFVVLGSISGVQCIVAAASGGVWICAGSRILKCSESGLVLAFADLRTSRTSINFTVGLEDRSGNLWLGTSGQGLFRLEDKLFIASPVSHREILSLAEDRDGNIWVGTRGGGLNRLSPKVVELEEIVSGPPFEAVRSVCQDRDGMLWAVARSGVVARRLESGWSVLGATNGWNIQDSMSVSPDPNGGVWIGTHYDGLFLWRDRVVTSYTAQTGLAGNFARSLFTSPNGDLWVGTASADGLQRLSKGQLKRFDLPDGSGLVRAMTMDAEGKLWVGTAAGNLLRVTGDVITEETSRSLPRLATIRCLSMGSDQSLWIGYGGSGVGRLKDGQFMQFLEEQGINDDYISQISHDAAGRLWFAGNKGVFYVDDQDFRDQIAGRVSRVRPVSFGREEGLPGLQASREAWPGVVRANDGRLWICMQTGLAVAQPAVLRAHPTPPAVTIESVAVDGHLVANYDAQTVGYGTANPGKQVVYIGGTERPQLTVAAGREQIAVEFTALSFASPRNVAFRYKLEGLEEEWVEAGQRRVANYSHPPPGKYQFKVIASDQGGNWSQSSADLHIRVLPQIWQIWWFQVLVTVILVGLVGGIVRYLEAEKMRMRIQLTERKGAIERERSRIAKDVHDDLGASLTEITLLSELAQGFDSSSEQLQTDMRKIAARTRNLTRALDATVWAVNPRNDTLESLASYTCTHAEDFLKSAGIRCRLEVPDHLPHQVLTAALRHNVFLIVKEALHNIVKHAYATEVLLRLSVFADGMLIEIEDNGKGFATVQEPTEIKSLSKRHGDGLLNMRKRAEDIGARFEIDQRASSGTRIQLEMRFDAA